MSTMITIREIQSAVARRYGFAVADLKGNRRTAPIVRPRQVAMFLSAQLTRHSAVAIGRSFGRGHDTVLHACRRIEAEAMDDPALVETLTELAQTLGAGALGAVP